MADKPQRRHLKIKPLAPPSVPSVIDADLVELDGGAMPIETGLLDALNGDPLAVRVSKEMMTMAGLGKSVEGVGTLRVGRGIVLFTQESLTSFLRILRTKFETAKTVEELLEISKALRNVAQSVAGLSKEYNTQNIPGKGKPPRRNNSFDLGKPVAVQQINNYYGKNEPKRD